MLAQVFEKLNHWMEAENERRRKDGGVLLPIAVFKVLGQTALIEAKVNLRLAATMDVDAYTQPAEWVITQKLDELLKTHGRHLDPHSSEIWMPSETQYSRLFQGQYVHAFLAEPEYVLLSKALKDPAKNRNLITEYLSKGASDLFNQLSQKYGLDLEKFL